MMYAVLCMVCMLLYGICWMFPGKIKYIMTLINMILAVLLWIIYPDGIIGHIISIIALLGTPLFTKWLGPAADDSWKEHIKQKKQR